jgi:polysaccharide pyruvyl transferase WcaK-like protein
MADGIFWGIIGAGASAIACSIGFATFWMNMQRQITEAKTEASAAGLRGVQANLKIDGLQTDLSNFRIYAEKEFVNHDDLKELVVRHEAQFDNLREDLKGITSRLDRLLESRIPAHN